MNRDRDDFRRRAAAVRQLPLESVLVVRSAARDDRDRSKWHTEQGPLSVNGPKFINWRRGVGGGRAIDLVMHLAASRVGHMADALDDFGLLASE